MTASPAHDEGLNVEEVASLTGTTVRTIRWYQSEGLLPPPRRAGRTARYDAEHVQRLEVIRDLQAHGLTLIAIRRLLQQPAGTTANALAFVRAAVSPLHEDEDMTIDAETGAARVGGGPPEETGQVLEQLGIVEVLPDGRWRLPAPALFKAAEELAALDFPLESRLDILHRLRSQTETMAKTLVDFFVDHLLPPSITCLDDPEAWDRLSSALDRLRPLATASVVALLDIALVHGAEEALERTLGAQPEHSSDDA